MIRFDTDTFYDEDALRVLGLDSAALARARKEGLLRCRRVGRVRLYKGEWLQDWLSKPEGEPGPPAAPGGGARSRPPGSAS